MADKYMLLLNPESVLFCKKYDNPQREKIVQNLMKLTEVMDAKYRFVITDRKDEVSQFIEEDGFFFHTSKDESDLAEALDAMNANDITFLYFKADEKTHSTLLNEYENSVHKYYEGCLIKELVAGDDLNVTCKEVQWNHRIRVKENSISVDNFTMWLSKENQKRFKNMLDIRLPVLVLGERGSGKTSVIQKFIKREMMNKYGIEESKFVSVPCGTLDGSLAEDQLFGHVKHAFTDAKNESVGFVGVANGGCLFLDEVQDLSRDIQRKLIKCVEEHVYTRIGAPDKLEKSDFFLVCSSNRSQKELQELLFEDFYDRISLFQVKMDSVEELKKTEGFLEDILPSVWENYMVRSKNNNIVNLKNFWGQTSAIKEKIMDALMRNELKGNFRDIEKLMAYVDLLVLAGDSCLTSGAEILEKLDPAIEEWEDYIIERNKNLDRSSDMRREDSAEDLEDLIEEYKWDGMNRLFRKWLAETAMKKYGSARAAARFLGKTKNVYLSSAAGVGEEED